MISQFRSFSKSPFAVGLFVLLLISFAVFGISDVFRSGPIKDAVVQAGSRAVTAAQFKQMFDGYRKQLEQQNQGQPITVEDAVANGLDRRLIENLAYTESLAAQVTKMGLRPSDKQVVSEIAKIPAFFDQISGRFDRPTYQQRLQEAGLTEPTFEASLRDEIAQNQLISGLASGLTAPRTYGAMVALYNREGRNVDWFAVGPRSVQAPPKPDDATLNAYLKANAQRFTKPETRQITLLRFSASQIAPTVAINPADVQKRFEFERDTLSTVEKRTFVQIPAKDAATANQAAQRLRQGQDAATVARSLGVQPVVYTDAPKTAVADRKVADAAFSMKEGDIAPVQGAIGMAVVEIQKVTPGKVATLEEVRPRVEAEVRKDAATEKVYDLVQKYEDARSGGANMVEASKKVGLTPTPIPVPLTAQGMTLNNQQSGLPPDLLKTAFSLPQGGESDVQNAGEGEYYAIRVDRINPPAVVSLDEARPAITQLWTLEELRKRMQAKADELAARVRKGEPLATVAQAAGVAVSHSPELRRDFAGPITANTVASIFNAKMGETVVAADDQAGVVVAKVLGVVPGPPLELARAAETQRQALRQSLFSDMGFAARNAARDAIKPRIDYARARTALGLEPEPAAQTKGAAPAPANKK